MDKPLILLPFVHGIDSAALSCALAFARKADATLLLVSFIRLSDKQVRAEAVAQRQDFFELMTHKAARAEVTIKCIPVSTKQIARSIQMLAQEMACAGTLLFVRNGKGVLLETEDIKQILEQPSQPVYLFRLVSRKNAFSRVGISLMHWLGHMSKLISGFPPVSRRQ
jgi:hypothetical protein